MNLKGPNVSEVSFDLQMPPLSTDETLPPINPVPIRRRKRKTFTSNMALSALRSERKRSYELLEKILMAKQEVLNDQQCQLDFLKSKVCALKEDNRMLKAQGHVQAAIIEKLDGKNAKLPMLVNSQMEEIRVYREQLKRLKDIFVRTNKAMQESESARYRAEEELQHLRDLAFEQNLPEREELVSALQQLREEYESIERDKVALEKYVHNLEKNQRCERTRLLRQQRDLQAKCATLASTVRGLQTDLQEKQRMLEAHAQRGRSRSTARGTADATAVQVQPPPQPTPSPHPVKTETKIKAQLKTNNQMGGCTSQTHTPKRNVKSSTRPWTTILSVEPRISNEVSCRPQTVEPTLDPTKSSCLGKSHDCELAVLKARENLARLVAEAKIKEEEEHITSKRNVSKAAPLTTIVGAQSYEDWPEFEVVEPLKMQPLPRPVKVQNDIKAIKKADATAARGDSMEIPEALQKSPARTVQEKSLAVISDLVREVAVAKERQDEFQAENADKNECSGVCSSVISKTIGDGDSVKLGSKILQGNPGEKKTVHSKESHSQHPHPTAANTITNVDSNNTNSAETTGNASNTRLASKLFDAQAKSAPPVTSYASLKQKTETPPSPECLTTRDEKQ
ncbi:Trafficking protein particle complex subunit 3 [Echinococcus multilocularis]|uniref:Trafficking protein particle complex subunit 3 n=1 Tax=Echinococcus multilocularis TaxID=6211 RepID=A0A068Y5L7_ECHMU|nr:Trafficking protein particle complex subunit 3 [Echinococcus multilocularis]